MSSNRPRRRGQEQEEPTPAKRGSLNNMELLGIGLFSLALLLWGVSKCGKDPVPEIEEPIVTEEVVDSTEAINNGASFESNDAQDPRPAPRSVDTTSFISKLYVTTDSLRFRKEPKLGGEVVGYLSYGEEVTDLGERTVLEKIRISADEVRTAPWVKIKNKKGKEGWAFGAYMQFYPVPTSTNMPATGTN